MTRSPGARASSIALAWLALLTATVPLRAQEWVVDAGAGSTTHTAVRGSTGALTGTLGVRLEGSRWLYLAGGVPLADAALPWAAGGLGTREAHRLWTGGGVGIDVAAHLYGYRDRSLGVGGRGATLEALPLVYLGTEARAVELRSGLVHHRGEYGDTLSTRTVHHSDLRASASTGIVRLIGEARFVRAEEGAYPYAGALAELSLGGVTLWGSAGRWLSDRLDESTWGAGASLRIAGVADLYGGFRREANDPLYRSGSRSEWSVGVSRALGRVVPVRGGAVPPPRVRGSSVTFRLPLSAAGQPPAVGGDFTGWEPVAMHREGAYWSVTLPVTPGLHRYAFRRADGEWFVPEEVPGRVDDGFGGASATVLVP